MLTGASRISCWANSEEYARIELLRKATNEYGTEPSNVRLPVAGRRRSRVTTASSRAAPSTNRRRRPARRAVAEAPRDARPDARARRVDAGVHDLREALQFSCCDDGIIAGAAAPASATAARIIGCPCGSARATTAPIRYSARRRRSTARPWSEERARVLALRGRRGCAHTRSRRAADERTAAGDDRRGRGRRVA